MSSMDRPIMQGWWRKRRSLLIAFACAMVGISLWWSFHGPQRSLQVNAEMLSIDTVMYGDFHDFIPLRATVVPRETIYLDAIEGGRVEQVFVEPGDRVIAGQPVVQLSNTELELNVLDREARLIESLTQLQAYQTQLEQNRLNNEKALALIDYEILRLSRSMERRHALVVNGVESKERSESIADELHYMRQLKPLQAESNMRQDALRVQQLPQIAAQLTKLNEDIEITRAKLGNLTVKAPADGQMIAIDLKVGENRNRGERLGEMTAGAGYKLIAQVDEYYLGRLQPNQPAQIEVAGRTWRLRISRVHPHVSGGTFNVELNFESDSPEHLLAGQAVQGKFALDTKASTLMLPAAPFLQHTGGRWIFVLVDGEHVAERRQIEIGRRNAEQVEIVRGLEDGERVITSDYSNYERVERLEIQ